MTDPLPVALATVVTLLCIPFVKYGWAALEAAVPKVEGWKAPLKVFAIWALSQVLGLAACGIAQVWSVLLWLTAATVIFGAANVWHRAGTPNGGNGNGTA